MSQLKLPMQTGMGDGVDYRELQATLKKCRDGGHTSGAFRLNQKRAALLAEYQRLVDLGVLPPIAGSDAKITALESQLAEAQEQIQALRAELQAYKALNDQGSQLDILLQDIVYRRGVGDNEIFESPEALQDKPDGEAVEDWAYFGSVLKRRYRNLANIYHPDKGGSGDCFKNLQHSYESAMAFVKINKGADL